MFSDDCIWLRDMLNRRHVIEAAWGGPWGKGQLCSPAVTPLMGQRNSAHKKVANL